MSSPLIRLFLLLFYKLNGCQVTSSLFLPLSLVYKRLPNEKRTFKLLGNEKTSVSENKSKNDASFPMITLAIVLNIIYFMLTHLTSCAYGVHILTQGDVLLSMVSTPLPSGSELPVTHCKKRLTIFPSPAGRSLSQLSLDWKN
jgi:hypothetical protein